MTAWSFRMRTAVFVIIATCALLVAHVAFLADDAAAGAAPVMQSPFTSNTARFPADARAPATPSVVRAPTTDTGIKSFLVKKAVQLISASFRHGGDLVGEVLKFVDKKAADTAKRHSNDIADELDRIANVPDLTSNIVKEQLYNALTRAGIDSGTALQIADGVKRVVDILVL